MNALLLTPNFFLSGFSLLLTLDFEGEIKLKLKFLALINPLEMRPPRSLQFRIV